MKTSYMCTMCARARACVHCVYTVVYAIIISYGVYSVSVYIRSYLLRELPDQKDWLQHKNSNDCTKIMLRKVEISTLAKFGTTWDVKTLQSDFVEIFINKTNDVKWKFIGWTRISYWMAATVFLCVRVCDGGCVCVCLSMFRGRMPMILSNAKCINQLINCVWNYKRPKKMNCFARSFVRCQQTVCAYLLGFCIRIAPHNQPKSYQLCVHLEPIC